MRALPRSKAWLAALVFCGLVPMRAADAGELAPYLPPGMQNQQVYERPTPMPSKWNMASPDNFARTAAELKPRQRKALLDSFRTQRDKALDARNYEAASHYIELISVLEQHDK